MRSGWDQAAELVHDSEMRAAALRKTPACSTN